MQDYKEYNLEAYYLAKEINLAKVADKLDKNLVGRRREFLTYLVGHKQFLFVFSFGAVVFVNIPKDTQGAMRKSLAKFLKDPVKQIYDETYALHEKEGKFAVGDESTELPVAGVEEIEIVARVLAQSVALEYIEDLADEALSNTDTTNVLLGSGGVLFQN